MLVLDPRESVLCMLYCCTSGVVFKFVKVCSSSYAQEFSPPGARTSGEVLNV